MHRDAVQRAAAEHRQTVAAEMHGFGLLPINGRKGQTSPNLEDEGSYIWSWGRLLYHLYFHVFHRMMTAVRVHAHLPTTYNLGRPPGEGFCDGWKHNHHTGWLWMAPLQASTGAQKKSGP
jgi:hypothetical protein